MDQKVQNFSFLFFCKTSAAEGFGENDVICNYVVLFMYKCVVYGFIIIS